MQEKYRWFMGLMVFMSMMGLLAIFLGVQYAKLDTSSLTYFSGYASTYYKGGAVFITIAGFFVVALLFVALAESITDMLYEWWENF